jgi:hypothetical protein
VIAEAYVMNTLARTDAAVFEEHLAGVQPLPGGG